MLKFKEEFKTIKWIFLGVFALVVTIALGYRYYSAFQETKMHEIVEKYAHDGVLIYGANESAPPLRFVDGDGQYKGVVVDFMNLISVELGVEIKCKPYKWDEALQNLRTGKTDMCDMFSNSEREKEFAFTDSLYTLRTMLVSRKSNEYTLSDINHLTVATEKGDYANWYMQKNYPNAKLVYVDNVGKGIDLLLSGQVDAAIGDEPVVLYYADKKNVRDKIASVNTTLYEEEFFLAVPKSKAELVKPLNAAIKKIRSKGQTESIQQKWFGISTPLKQDNTGFEIIIKYIAIGVALALLAVAFKLIENKSLRHKVKQRTRQLEQRKNELDLMLNEMPEGVIVIDSHYNIVSFNPQAVKMIKLVDVNIQGMPCNEYLEKLGVELSEDEYKDIKETDSKKLRVNCGNEVLEINIFGVGTEDVIAKNIMLTIKDITLDVIKNNQLLQSSKMIAVGQLAAGMAHELRNPLGIIRTQSYILRRNKAIDEGTRIALNYIDESVNHAGGIIDNVMNFWRMGDGDTACIKIKPFIESIIELNDDEIRKKKINVRLECNQDLTVNSSVEALKHILMNLIQNAIDAIDNDWGEIRIVTERDGKNITISCKDNGVGIAREDLANLYNPFFTTKPPGKGTGLGLFVTYSEIGKLGGSISVDSTQGVGTTFTLLIPDEKMQGGSR